MVTLLMGCTEEIPNDNISPMDSSLLGISVGTSSTQNVTTTTVTVTTTESVTSKEVTTSELKVLGYTQKELTTIAEDLYYKACEKYQDVLINCYYGVDLYDCIVDETGKKYFLVTDDAYNTIQDVLTDWNSIFSKSLDNLVDASYLEYNGYLYGYTAIKQQNTNYNSSNLEYYSSNDNEVTFKVVADYSSGEKIFNFSIEYSPDTHEWRVSKFTMPY